jgi:hypothetical protein
MKVSDWNMFPEKFLQVFNSSSALAIFLMLDDGVHWVRQGNFDLGSRRAFLGALEGEDLETRLHDLNRFAVVRVKDQNYVLYAKHLLNSNHLLGMIYPPDKPLSQMQNEMLTCMRKLDDGFLKRRTHAEGVEQTLQSKQEPSMQPFDQADTLNDLDWRKAFGSYSTHKKSESLEKEARAPDEHKKDNLAEHSKNYRVYGAPMRTQKSDAFQQPLDVDIEVMMEERPWLPIGENWSEADADGGPRKAPLAELIDDPSNQNLDEGARELVTSNQRMNSPTEDLVSILHDDFELNGDSSALDAWMLPILGAEQALPESLDERPLSEGCHPQTDDLELEFEENVANITFYLVPRDSSQDLTVISECLMGCFTELCLLYGWELEQLSMDPQYIKWTFVDFPECLIQNMLSIVQGYTSERIFHAFPDLPANHPTDKFWSSDYFMETKGGTFDLIAL